MPSGIMFDINEKKRELLYCYFKIVSKALMYQLCIGVLSNEIQTLLTIYLRLKLIDNIKILKVSLKFL